MAGKRGGGKKAAKDKQKTGNMQAAAAGEAPRLNLPQPRDLKHHYDTISGYKARLDEANGHLRNAYKQAEEAGVDTAAIRMAMSKAKKDPMVMRNFYAQLSEHLKEQGQPFQIALFDTIKGTPAEQAYRAGFDCGASGGTPQNPYPPGSEPFVYYSRGNAHGYGKNIGQTTAQVDSALGEEPLPMPWVKSAEPDRGTGKAFDQAGETIQ